MDTDGQARGCQHGRSNYELHELSDLAAHQARYQISIPVAGHISGIADVANAAAAEHTCRIRSSCSVLTSCSLQLLMQPLILEFQSPHLILQLTCLCLLLSQNLLKLLFSMCLAAAHRCKLFKASTIRMEDLPDKLT